ncbi:hypothetical protein F4802DRAFT_545548 [Xylaria palmicola]|nr:hypothetical protein F4802DRAFT_545548 [Xylaria palmicola]
MPLCLKSSILVLPHLTTYLYCHGQVRFYSHYNPQFGDATDDSSPRADVPICVVDGRIFTRGQFTPDAWLLQTYRSIVKEIGRRVRRFFDLRNADEKYLNGE